MKHDYDDNRALNIAVVPAMGINTLACHLAQYNRSSYANTNRVLQLSGPTNDNI